MMLTHRRKTKADGAKISSVVPSSSSFSSARQQWTTWVAGEKVQCEEVGKNYTHLVLHGITIAQFSHRERREVERETKGRQKVQERKGEPGSTR